MVLLRVCWKLRAAGKYGGFTGHAEGISSVSDTRLQTCTGWVDARGWEQPTDSIMRLPDLSQVLKPGAKIMMVGTVEAVTAALDAQAEVAPHVQDDFNTAAGVLDDVADFVDREENQVPCLVADAFA